MDLITAWNPDEEQWWITGFDPECKDEKADAKNQVMIGSVQFRNGEMYEAFKYSMTIDENKKSEFITYDDNNKTVWIMWYERSSI